MYIMLLLEMVITLARTSWEAQLTAWLPEWSWLQTEAFISCSLVLCLALLERGDGGAPCLSSWFPALSLIISALLAVIQDCEPWALQCALLLAPKQCSRASLALCKHDLIRLQEG